MQKVQGSIVHIQFAICILQFAICNISSATQAETPLAVTIEGEPFHAELVAADNWQLTFAEGQSRRVVAAAELLRWGRPAEQGRAGGLVLADGGFVNAELIAADKDTLTADSTLFGTLKLPLESVAGAVVFSPSDQNERDRLMDRLARATGETDRLLLDNGDELAGVFEGMAGDACTMKTDAGPVKVKNDRVVAILFNPALRRVPTVEKNAIRAWTGFSDGSRLLAQSLITDGERLKLVASGQPFIATWSSLVFLQPMGGRAVYLSDLKRSEYRQTPFLPFSATADRPDLSWPLQTDRNAAGGFLRCGGQLYLKGLGVHSAARVVYSISPLPLGEGQGVRAVASRFEAQVGIDDSTSGGGSVVFRVLVDGQERYASPVVRGGDAPLPVSVDVRGAKKLELLVDYADRADVLDRADWLDARLEE